MPQPSSSVAAGGEGGAGGLYDLDAYEVSFPLEESIERPPAYRMNQGQQMMDGTPHLLHVTAVVMITPSTLGTSFIKYQIRFMLTKNGIVKISYYS